MELWCYYVGIMLLVFWELTDNFGFKWDISPQVKNIFNHLSWYQQRNFQENLKFKRICKSIKTIWF